MYRSRFFEVRASQAMPDGEGDAWLSAYRRHKLIAGLASCALFGFILLLPVLANIFADPSEKLHTGSTEAATPGPARQPDLDWPAPLLFDRE